MTPRELLAQKPDTVVTDKYTEEMFSVGELTPIVTAMLGSSDPGTDDFCERFVVRQDDCQSDESPEATQ